MPDKAGQKIVRGKSKPAKVVEIMEEVSKKTSYDVELLDDFLSLIFGEKPEDEKILAWGTKTDIGLPVQDGDLLSALVTDTEQRALFVSSSTAKIDLGNNQVYNRDDLFYGLYVVTADVKQGMSIPDELKPTYSITIGPDKQYGYVLKTPIYDHNLAKALVQLLASTPYFKAGLPTPQKLIRLPQGIKGGMGQQRFQQVQLTYDKGSKWTPKKLLDILDLGTSWSELSESPLRAIQESRMGILGTAPFCQREVRAIGLNGIIDPVLEWLFKNYRIKQQINDSFTVICPFSDTHSGGDENATYIPIGNLTNPDRRDFRCKDPSCRSSSTENFLRVIHIMGCKREAVNDITPRLVSEYVFDISENAIWRIGGKGIPKVFKIEAFKNANPFNLKMIGANGKVVKKAAYTHWKESKYRMIVEGRTFAPSSRARIVRGYEDELMVNRFAVPPWGDGDYSLSEVERFTDFMVYLMPNVVEREYFLNWLACKVQNMGFRGIAIIMVAKKQGTGRNTLADMMAQLFGPANLEHVPFNKMLGTSDFNEWAESPIIVTDETLSNTDHNGFKQAYEKLKELIDPRPKPVRINPKWGFERISMIYSSFMFMSNHENAIAISEHDRRFYVITNAIKPASPEYFGSLNRWLQRKDENRNAAWAKHVWRWLLERQVNIDMMLSPPLTTAGKKRMLLKSKSRIELTIEGLLNNIDGKFISSFMVNDALQEMKKDLGFKRVSDVQKEVSLMLRERTLEMGNGVVMKVCGKTTRVRLIINKVTALEAEDYSRAKMSKKSRDTIRLDINASVDKKNWDRLIASTKEYVAANYG